MIKDREYWAARRQGDSAISWHRATSEAELAKAIFEAAEKIRKQSESESLRDIVYDAIYEGRPLGNALFDATGFVELQRLTNKAAHTSVNRTQQKIDALTSRLGKKRPFPCLSTEGADHEEKKFAESVSKAMRHKLGADHIARELPLVMRDALVRGTGCAMVRARGGDLVVERVPRSEMLVDSVDGRYGRPRNLIRYSLCQRDELLAAYPDKEDAILGASCGTNGWFPAYQRDSEEHVLVCEAWHLPVSYGAKGGRHVVAIADHVLLDEPWEVTRFPVAFLHWCPPMQGFWGRGLVETLSSIQQKINEVLRDIQEALYYGGQLTVFVPRGANINKHHLQARHPKIVETDGAVPNYLAPNPVAPQMFQLLQLLEQMADDASGLARDYTAGKTQLGANASGKAMDTLYDIQSDRFALAELNLGYFSVDLGKAIIDGARGIAGSLPRNKQAEWIKETKWSSVDIDDGCHEMRLEPVNFLPDTRAGRLESVAELSKAGVITDPTMLAELFTEPDIQAANREMLGPRRAASKIIEIINDRDRNINEAYPDPHLDLAGLKKRLLSEYANARADEADGDTLARYREVLSYTEHLIAQATPTPPPSAPPATLDPAQSLLPGAAMAPQTSAMPPELAALGAVA